MRVLAFALTILAAVLGPMTAALHAQPHVPGSSIVLCSDIGAVVVLVGADGMPLPDQPQVRHCDDCLPLPQPALLNGPVPASGVARSCAHPVWTDRRAAQPSSCAVPVPAARGPPTVI